MQVKSNKSRVQFKTLCGITVLSLMLVFFIGGCKKFGIPDYKLTITLDEGVNGSPAAGEYEYQELTVVEYDYSPENEDFTVEVLVNGSRFGTSGQLTMYTDMDIKVGIFDVRGTWTVDFRQPQGSSEDDLEFEITFTGDSYLSGSFSDSRGEGFSGLWSISDTTITITYSNWQNYVLTGTIPVMSGTWTGENQTGAWIASR